VGGRASGICTEEVNDPNTQAIYERGGSLVDLELFSGQFWTKQYRFHGLGIGEGQERGSREQAGGGGDVKVIIKQRRKGGKHCAMPS